MDKPLIKVGYMTSTIQNLPDVILKWNEDKKGNKFPYTLIDYISDELSYEVPNLQFVLQSRPNWDGRVRLLKISKAKKNKDYDAKFHTGLVFRVIKTIYDTIGVVPKVEDYRKKPGKNFEWEWNENFEIRDYQEKVISECVKKGRGLISIATGGGKCCDKSTLIPTEEGMLPISYFSKIESKKYEKLEINVQSEFGLQKTLHFYNDGISESIEIETNEGYRISGTPEHKIKVLCEDGEVRFCELKNINKKHIPLIYRGASVFGKGDISEDEAYFMGILIGDGGLNKKNAMTLTTEENHIADFYKEFLKKHGFSFRIEQNSKKSINIVSKKDSRDFVEEKFLAGYHLSTDKEIPINILKSKKESISAFIRGLYETDGWTEKKGCICIGLSNETLIRNIQIVLLQYGIISWIRKKKTTHKDNYILVITDKISVSIFIENKMLDAEGYKILKINNHLNHDKKTNTNTDLLYYSKDRIHNIYMEKYEKASREEKNKFIQRIGIPIDTMRSYFRERQIRNPSINTARNIFNETDLEISKYLNGDFYFSKIKEIKTKTGHNYDFEIPSTRSFIGNGFVNHNTIVVSKIIQELGVTPFIFYVLTKDLMHQAKERLESSIIGLECGLVGDGVCDIKDVTIMTIQTTARAFDIMDLEKDMSKVDGWSDGELVAIKSENLDHLKKKEEIKNLIESAKGLYFDECHHAAAKICEEVITKSKRAYYCFGGTATPTREDNADLMLEGIFGGMRGNISASFLIKKGYLVRPEIYFLKLKKKGSRATTYDQDYKENLMFNEERNELIVAAAEKMKSMNLPTLILVQRIDHGKLLESMISDSVFVHGSSSKNKRTQILKDFETGKIKMLIASTIADEGLDLPILETLILAGGGRSKNRIKQRIGRVIRVHKKKPNKRAIVIDFEDNGYYISKHSRERKKILKLEEEFKVSTVNGLEGISDIFMDNLF